MNNLVKRFNLSFSIFVIFIFFIAIFWLFQKHTVGNDSTISEWMINYQGGFTRRGIIGEICFQLAVFFDLKLRFVIFLFQSFLYLIYSILIYKFIKDTPKNILTIAAIYSPIFLLYPVGEIEVLARKEIFLYVGFIIFLNLSNIRYSKNTPLFYIFFIFPILCLIWEPFIFFFPFAAFIILVRNNEKPFKILILKIFLSFSTSIIVAIIILITRISEEEHLIMVNSLMDNFGETCYMSCAVLLHKSSVNAQFNGVSALLNFEVIFRYSIIILIGFSALSFLCLNTKIKNKNYLSESEIYKWIVSKNLLVIFIFLLLPTLVLFSSMTDWGRVVNMTYVFSILTYIHLQKNDLTTINQKVFIFDNFFANNRKMFIFLFVIFAFGWNQKTGMTGDISTNTLYKIVYNTSKKTFGFNSTRLFQDAPLIKFHKKFIE